MRRFSADHRIIFASPDGPDRWQARYPLTIAAAAVVPEPASWALFIMGFGAIGGALRRRSGAVRVSKAKLNFA